MIWRKKKSRQPETEIFDGTVNFLCISVWHMWVWYLGEPDDAGNFKCDIAIKKRNVREEESELKYSGRVHSIRIPPHRIILSGCLLSFSDYTAAHFRYIGKFSWTTGCRRDRRIRKPLKIEFQAMKSPQHSNSTLSISSLTTYELSTIRILLSSVVLLTIWAESLCWCSWYVIVLY